MAEEIVRKLVNGEWVTTVENQTGGGGGSQSLADVLAVGNDGNGVQVKNLAAGTDPDDAATVSQLGGGSQPLADPGHSWAAETPVAEGYRITVDLADSPTGDYIGVMEVSTAGTTGADEPTWRTGLDGSPVTDDTAVWTYIGELGRFEFSIVGPTIVERAAGEVQAGPRATVLGDGTADTAQRATVTGDGTVVASLSGYAGTGSVDVDSSGSTGGDGSVDASSTAQVGGSGTANARTTAEVIADGDADVYSTAHVHADGNANAGSNATVALNGDATVLASATAGLITGAATSGIRSRAGTGNLIEISLIATATEAGVQLVAVGIPDADPMIVGALWFDSGVLTKSAAT